MKLVSTVTAGLILCLAIVPAEAKHKNKLKTVVGCVQGTPDHYELSAVTKAGKKRLYTLVGRDFGPQRGHKVQAHGALVGTDLKVTSLKDLSPSCP